MIIEMWNILQYVIFKEIWNKFQLLLKNEMYFFSSFLAACKQSHLENLYIKIQM